MNVTLTVDGKDYHHIFDSQTGYPVETELASLTIISDKSVDGEIWTTRLFEKDLLLSSGKSKVWRHRSYPHR